MDTREITTPDGLDIVVPEHCLISRRMDRIIYESDLIDAVRDIHDDRPGTVIDAGAHIGNHSLRFAQFADRVLSFEPNPPVYRLLATNMERNSPRLSASFSHFQMALGRQRGYGRVFAEHGNTGNTIVVPENDTPKQDRFVSIFRLDEVARNTVSVIKIDVEGMELDVLSGAWDLLDQYRPDLFVECGKTDRADVLALLDPLNYRPVEAYAKTPTWHFRPE